MRSILVGVMLLAAVVHPFDLFRIRAIFSASTSQNEAVERESTFKPNRVIG